MNSAENSVHYVNTVQHKAIIIILLTYYYDNGRPITKEAEQRKHWDEHFKRLLNRLPPTTRPIIPTVEAELPVDINPPTKTEILKAIKMLKTGKAAGPDGIPAEALKMNPETSADLMTPLLEKVRREGKAPEDWKKDYLLKLPKRGDLGQCKNWSGIMLLPIPSKILSRIILERIKHPLDEKLPEPNSRRPDVLETE
ncbi:unnamed protein product [Trichobilharzia szidati]|nr:unnamed protein product [Trichobilharzia szidati]